ncbi:hypothetical protein CTEN210_15427 [Chaetoceros tenuissimus]|uniref:Seipin n=1 Tax=Chaetoceros tenuissimus TaxID=426638 RepID=A0AAD3HD85_9STRA|nr:hypothetical protein CTEN210_15427 [Chaetoceros tenuissimus]
MSERIRSAVSTAAQVKMIAEDAYHIYQDTHERHHTIRREGKSFFGTIIPLIKHAFYWTMSTFILFSTSVGFYVLFYCLIMPEHDVTRPIYFDYNDKYCGEAICPPTAKIDLLSSNTQWHAHVPSVVPVVDRNDKCDGDEEDEKKECSNNDLFGILEPENSYFFQVALIMPESNKNREVGMFMIESILKSNVLQEQKSKDSKSKVIASSSRPSLLPYQSTYVSMVKKSFLMIPLILSAIPEARTIVIETFDHYIESAQDPMNEVEIRLVVPKSQNQNTKPDMYSELQIWKAELKIGKELNKLQRIMKKWFYSSAIVGITLFMSIQIYIIALVKMWKYGVKTLKNKGVHNIDTFDDPDDYSEQPIYMNMENMENEDNPSVIIGNAAMFDEDDSNWEATENIPQKESEENKDESIGGDNSHLSAMQEATGTSNTKKSKRKRKKKKKALKKEVVQSKEEANLQRTKDEEIVTDRVMRGDFERYELFTDLDEPE